MSRWEETVSIPVAMSWKFVDRCSTYADLSFIPWNRVDLDAPFFKDELWEKYEIRERFPHFLAWHERLNARSSVKSAYAG